MISDSGNSFVEMHYIIRFMEKPKFIIGPTHYIDFILITLDPNQVGPNEMAMIATVNLSGSKVVSNEFYFYFYFNIIHLLFIYI